MYDECFAVILGIERVCNLVGPSLMYMRYNSRRKYVGEHVCYISPAYIMVFLSSVITCGRSCTTKL